MFHFLQSLMDDHFQVRLVAQASLCCLDTRFGNVLGIEANGALARAALRGGEAEELGVITGLHREEGKADGDGGKGEARAAGAGSGEGERERGRARGQGERGEPQGSDGEREGQDGPLRELGDAVSELGDRTSEPGESVA